MVEQSVVTAVQDYVTLARSRGLNISGAAVYGSHARGSADSNSDIDLVVFIDGYAPEDERALVGELWALRAESDSRIEPVLCTHAEWTAPDCRLLIASAREYAVDVPLGERAVPAFSNVL